MEWGRSLFRKNTCLFSLAQQTVPEEHDNAAASCTEVGLPVDGFPVLGKRLLFDKFYVLRL